MTDIHSIEEQINIDAFNYNGENIWPLFRNRISWDLNLQITTTPKESKQHLKFSRLHLVGAFFWNILTIINFFRRYNYILVTNSDNYRCIDNTWFNRMTSSLLKELKGKKVLEIQQGLCIKHDVNGDDVKYASYSILNVVSEVVSWFVKVQDIQLIESELIKVNLSINVKKVIASYMAKEKVVKWLYQHTQAKKVYMTCYGYFLETKVANDLGIDTIEFQHGNILNHFAYDVRYSVNHTFYPKYLCVFGQNERDYLKRKYYINDYNNILVIGNYMIDMYRNRKNQIVLDLKK